MNNHFDKRLLWVSFLLHIIILGFLVFINPRSRINKMFVAYGRHSREMTHAYFRRLVAPKNRFVRKVRQPEKSVAARKTVARKRPALKKIVQKKPVQKKVAPKKVAKQKPKKIITPKKIEGPPKKVAKKEEVEQEDEMLYFNLMGETDPLMIKYQTQIQQEVDRVWNPPLGVPKGTECEVKFFIADDGTVDRFEVVKPSKIIIYNLSIVRIAKDLKFEFLKGKSFALNFRQ